MPISADRKSTLAALAKWLAQPSQLPVVRVLQSRRPETDHPAFFMEVPRLIVVLDGRGTFLTIDHDREVIFDIAPGQVLYLAAFTWICPAPRSTYKSLGIIFRHDSTRVTIHKRQRIRSDGTIPARYLAQWRTKEVLGAKGDHLLALLRDTTFSPLGEGAFNSLVEILIREVAHLVGSAPEHIRSSQTILWQSVSDYVSEHWSDPDLSRKTTAQFFNRHPNHFSRFFHSQAKQNFRTYVNEIRLERSIHFLRDLRYNVTDVASLCGFTDLQYFIRCFHHRFGFTPGDYRRRMEN